MPRGTKEGGGKRRDLEKWPVDNNRSRRVGGWWRLEIRANEGLVRMAMEGS